VLKHTYEELQIKIENLDITPDKLEQFRSLITAFGDVFALYNSELEGTDLLEYEIHLTTIARRRAWKLNVKSRNFWQINLSRDL